MTFCNKTWPDEKFQRMQDRWHYYENHTSTHFKTLRNENSRWSETCFTNVIRWSDTHFTDIRWSETHFTNLIRWSETRFTNIIRLSETHFTDMIIWLETRFMDNLRSVKRSSHLNGLIIHVLMFWQNELKWCYVVDQNMQDFVPMSQR